MIPERLTVAAIVKSKSEASDGYAIELEIASFNSQYPIKLTRVPQAIAAQIKPGAAMNLNLIRQSLKKNKDGTIKTGNFPTDYFWGLEGIASTVVAQQPSPQIQGTASTSPVATRDLRDESIRQQVAVKEIGAMLCAGKPVNEALTRGYWSVVTEWLYAGITPASLPNPPPPVAQVPPAQSGEIFWPHFATIGDMMNYGTKQGVLMQEFASFLGVQKIIDWKGTPDEAWNIIATKKNLKPEHAK